MSACAKTRYETRIKALYALATIRANSDRDKCPCRAYPCPDCKGWHLTSLGGRGSKHTRPE